MAMRCTMPREKVRTRSPRRGHNPTRCEHRSDPLFRLRHAVQPGEETQVLLRGQAVVEQGRVRHDAQVAPDAVRMLCQVEPADAHRAAASAG